MTHSDSRCPFADDFDATAAESFDGAHENYRRLRDEAPVAYSSGYGGFYALTRFEDVEKAARDSTRFISSVRAVVPSDPRGIRRPPLNFDAPAHSPFRRALDRTLHHSRLERLAPRLRAHAEREIQPFLDAGTSDICRSFGTIYPAFTAAEWLNLDRDQVYRLASVSSDWVDAWRRQDGETVTARSNEMYDMARALVADRRANPRPVETDPASSLLAEEYEGAPLAEELVVGALRQSLVVGLVAPPILLGGICVHLSRDQDLQSRLRADPALIPAALEEFIRLYTPYRGFARTVSEPVEVHGRLIEPGVPVTLVYASANRDERVFPDPDAFVLDRSNISRHMGFGRGRHRCVGMALARLSLRIALEVLLERTQSFDVAGEIEMTRMPELGAQSVPLRVVPA
ncbi:MULTISPECIES: cytochrome P450 [Microbacterium]|uniref:Cytochrome P450 n=2 Tax=Microbacterium wangchenii TaxID=2541726 RepID=A0ABX5SZ83_9MICO|nr:MULTISPECIES: cytochrome P450 [Microbacterium]MCK6068048.1 cytochrome P450 [Microbacterium sp. EYE_512]QBR90565.1 cytochrome P450 [Microbacterium wangchenii]TFV84057.1 cytochrome P450 [Microbacterium sp. dk485]TXK16114.1 cytochrome P450 [Microbacterium wangchenii]